MGIWQRLRGGRDVGNEDAARNEGAARADQSDHTGHASELERAAALIARLIDASDAVVVGAGAGLSASAGFTYDGARFQRYFADFERAYGFHDMYTGGFYPFPSLEEQWAYWSRFIYVNRYAPMPSDTYALLRELVGGRDYMVLTTNVDHCFQRAGFDRERLFYTQGDYGLWQCSVPCHQQTYDNEETVRAMVTAQGFQIDTSGALVPPDDLADRAHPGRVPEELVPRCPRCGEPMSMNLRADDTFVEDAGWHAAAARYQAFLERIADTRVVFIELGVGGNTPGIIKYPFWRMTAQLPHAVYVCVNQGEAACPREISDRALLINADITPVLRAVAAARP